MTGRLEAAQDQLFYNFRFADFVPDDYLVRRIDAALDLSWPRAELQPFYSVEGRQSIDPELMIRMPIRMPILGRHGRFRDRDLFRRVFERVVATCIEAGLP